MSSPSPGPASWRVAVAVPVVLAMLSMIGPFSIDTPFPAFPEMARDFGVAAGEMQLVVTAYLASFAVMSVFHGPLSDAVGRRPVILWSVAVYVVASVAAMFAPSLGLLLATRVVQGLSAGGATIVSRTVIRDLFEGETAHRLMSRVALIFGLAPAIAPVIGGLLLQVGPWPLVFGFQAGLGLLLVVLVLLVLPETHPPSARVPLRVGEVVRGLTEVARHAAFQRVAWAATLAFGAQFLYIGGAAIFVVDLLGQGELDFWKFFVPMIGAMMVGSWISGRSAGRITARRLVSVGFVTTVVAGAVGTVIAASPVAGVIWWAVAGPSLIALGNGMAYPALQLMLLDLFPARRGAVVSSATFITLVFNAVAAVALTPLVARSTLGLAVAALVFVVLGAILWWWHATLEHRDPVVAPCPEELEPTESL